MHVMQECPCDNYIILTIALIALHVVSVARAMQNQTQFRDRLIQIY